MYVRIDTEIKEAVKSGTGVADETVFGNVQKIYGKVLFRQGWL
ncbi:hypothetical protein ACFLYC_03335 [Chloroflexota bacterium]